MNTAARNLTVIQINDTHGYLEPHPELVWTEVGDNGDTFHGTYPAVKSRGEAPISLVNALGLDAMTAHWEFAWGPAHVQQLAARLNYPLLATNCYDSETGNKALPGVCRDAASWFESWSYRNRGNNHR